ncbi:hypothetical protein ACFVUS_01695 [Nocardia sp. NPDC058058]|uniref:hypothetical protein n=1 Tax=Nocardia sp. NPDC058058 TaxID=3346317 RepID=UPI0036DA9528
MASPAANGPDTSTFPPSGAIGNRISASGDTREDDASDASGGLVGLTLMTLDEVAAELYGASPADFVTLRTERAGQARADGDRALATAIGKLRRPTVAAWAVNLLAREAADDIVALLDLGGALREAQRRLSAEQLRALSTQRQQVISALTRKAGDLAAAHGQRLTESVLRDIGGTLQAALADADIGDQVSSGTLTAAASYEGFGPAGLVAVPSAQETPKAPESPGGTAPSARTGSSPRKRSGTQGNSTPNGSTTREGSPRTRSGRAARASDADIVARDEARRELEESLANLESARAAVLSARSTHEAATVELAQLESRITELRDELAQAQQQRRFTVAAERSARESLRQAEQQLAAAERRATAARNELS